MSIVSKLLDAAGLPTGKCYVDTGLKSILGDSNVVLTVDLVRMGDILGKMRKAISIDIPLDRLDFLQLLDEYHSSTIDGANTTMDEIVSGTISRSTVMARQSLMGFQHLLHKELSEYSLIDAWKIVADGWYDNASAGYDGYRKCNMYEGKPSEVVHITAPVESISTMMNSLLKYEHEFVLVNAAAFGFYLYYVYPFAVGNGRMSRMLMKKIIGIPALPLSKAIDMNRIKYYQRIHTSEVESKGKMDITPFFEFILDMVDTACDMLDLCTKPFDSLQGLLLQSLYSRKRTYISYNEVMYILGVDIDVAVKVVDDLCEMGYLEYSSKDESFKLIWR